MKDFKKNTKKTRFRLGKEVRYKKKQAKDEEKKIRKKGLDHAIIQTKKQVLRSYFLLL